MTILSSLFETVGEQLDGIIDAYRRGAIPEHPETIVMYRDGTISSYNIVGTFNGDSIINFTNVNDVKLGNTVTEIGNGTFSYSYYLSSITIPSSVTTFGDRSFWETPALKTIVIPKTVTLIGVNAFYGTGLETITFENRTISEVQSMTNYGSSYTSWRLGTAPSGVSTFQRTIICTDGTFTVTAYRNDEPV